MTDPRTLAIFDFDKTLVARDSFRLFGGLGASGPVERALLFGYAALARIGVISNTRYKVLVLQRVWLRRRAAARAVLLTRVQEALQGLVVESTTTALRAHLDRGDRVAVLTASPEFYIASFLADISPAIELHGSQVQERDGKIRLENLYGKRKAAVAGTLITEMQPGLVHVYTDHEHDIALMRLAGRVSLIRPKAATIAAVEKAGIEFDVLAT